MRSSEKIVSIKSVKFVSNRNFCQSFLYTFFYYNTFKLLQRNFTIILNESFSWLVSSIWNYPRWPQKRYWLYGLTAKFHLKVYWRQLIQQPISFPINHLMIEERVTRFSRDCNLENGVFVEQDVNHTVSLLSWDLTTF